MSTVIQAIALDIAGAKGGPFKAYAQARIEALLRALPSGSGWDQGTSIDLDNSTPDHIAFYGDFHHMDEHGGYDGWTAHRIYAKPSLQFGFVLRITGPDRNGIKDHLYEIFYEALAAEAKP